MNHTNDATIVGMMKKRAKGIRHDRLDSIRAVRWVMELMTRPPI